MRPRYRIPSSANLAGIFGGLAEGGSDVRFQQEVPGAKDQDHVTVEGAGHFIQESHGSELAAIIVEFIAANPLPQKSGG